MLFEGVFLLVRVARIDGVDQPGNPTLQLRTDLPVHGIGPLTINAKKVQWFDHREEAPDDPIQLSEAVEILRQVGDDDFWIKIRGRLFVASP